MQSVTSRALELAVLLVILDLGNAKIRRAKVIGPMDLARQETSANGRHYYNGYAKELLADTELTKMPSLPAPLPIPGEGSKKSEELPAGEGANR